MVPPLHVARATSPALRLLLGGGGGGFLGRALSAAADSPPEYAALLESEARNCERAFDRDRSRRIRQKLQDAYARFTTGHDDATVVGDHVYYEVQGRVCRRELRAASRVGAGPEELLVDLDRAPPGATSRDARLRGLRVSPGRSRLALTVSRGGSAALACLVLALPGPGRAGRRRRLRSPGAPLLCCLPSVTAVEWATDSVLYYTEAAEQLIPRAVCALQLGDAGAATHRLFQERDDSCFVGLARTRDGRFVTVNRSWRGHGSEVLLLDTAAPLRPPRVVQERAPGLTYHVERAGGRLHVLAALAESDEYQVLRASESAPGREGWRPLWRPPRGTRLLDVDFLDSCLVASLTAERGALALSVVPYDRPDRTATVQLAPWACVLEPDASPGRDAERGPEEFGFRLSSPVLPGERRVLDVASGRVRGDAGDGDPGGDATAERDAERSVERDGYSVRRLHAVSQDGTAVPLTVLHSRDPPGGDLSGRPLLAHVYGAYGVDVAMGFRPELRVLADAGWVLAFCHVRGGGERGRWWHAAGRGAHKRAGLHDLRSCLAELHARGLSRPGLTALAASSAGAVLAGALCNESPGLVRAVVLQAPFLDVLGTMRRPELPLTPQERGEWGDPLSDAAALRHITSYCPYTNVRPQAYPAMYISCSLGDRLVPAAGVLRYVSRLRQAMAEYRASRPPLAGAEAATEPPLVVSVHEGGSHCGPGDLDGHVREVRTRFLKRRRYARPCTVKTVILSGVKSAFSRIAVRPVNLWPHTIQCGVCAWVQIC
uniref:Prolyl endopeptidase n=1 Tax=Petromyzon marinus TaxID=7757 RepID=A0AAJ7TKL4_PETMA|nr:prolyl endopeptidase-like isoform X2 [Petromyzon marinus]